MNKTQQKMEIILNWLYNLIDNINGNASELTVQKEANMLDEKQKTVAATTTPEIKKKQPEEDKCMWLENQLKKYARQENNTRMYGIKQ